MRFLYFCLVFWKRMAHSANHVMYNSVYRAETGGWGGGFLLLHLIWMKHTKKSTFVPNPCKTRWLRGEKRFWNVFFLPNNSWFLDFSRLEIEKRDTTGSVYFLITRFRWYLQYRYFTYNIVTLDNLTK